MFDVLTLAVIIILAFIILVVLIILLSNRRYPVEVEIIRQQANGDIILLKDRGGFFTDRKTKTTEFKLMKAKRIIPIITYNDLFSKKKAKPKLFLKSFNPSHFIPMTIKETEIKDTNITEEAFRAAHVNLIKKLQIKFQHKSVLEQFLPIILIIITAFMFVLIMVGWNNGVSDTITQMGQQIGTLENLVNRLTLPETPPF